VEDYRLERWRQEQMMSDLTGSYPGDITHWKAKGGKLIDFGHWLRAHKRNH
jgi:hypothetical protein